MSQPVPMGRKITVRLVPYGTPAAGVSMMTCSGGGCPADPTRFRDPVAARTAARAHVARHIHELGEPTDPARCRCGSSACEWHPARRVARCAGPSTLVLIPDATERVWMIAEICAECASAIPRVKILKGDRPPAVADPSPPASTQPPSSAPTKQAAHEAKAAQRARALNCPVCAAEAPLTPRVPKESPAQTPRPVLPRPVAAGVRELAASCTGLESNPCVAYSDFDVYRRCSRGREPKNRLGSPRPAGRRLVELLSSPPRAGSAPSPRGPTGAGAELSRGAAPPRAVGTLR